MLLTNRRPGTATEQLAIAIDGMGAESTIATRNGHLPRGGRGGSET